MNRPLNLLLTAMPFAAVAVIAWLVRRYLTELAADAGDEQAAGDGEDATPGWPR